MGLEKLHPFDAGKWGKVFQVHVCLRRSSIYEGITEFYVPVLIEKLELFLNFLYVGGSVHVIKMGVSCEICIVICFIKILSLIQFPYKFIRS